MSKPINPHPEKALPHVVTALIQKRGELGGRINHLQTELRQAVVDLDNVEATLRIFAPHAIIDLAPRNIAPSIPAARGENARIILIAMREATRPLTTNELTEAVMKARGLAIDNAAMFHTMSKRISACLRYLKNERGVVRTMPGPGKQHLWQIVSAQA